MYIMNIIVLQIWENRQVNAFRMLITIWDDLTHWVHMIFTRTPSPPQWPLQGRQGEKQHNCWWRADQTLRHLNVSYFCWRSVAWAVFKMFYIPVYCLVHRDHEIFLKFTWMDDDIRTHKLMGIFYIYLGPPWKTWNMLPQSRPNVLGTTEDLHTTGPS